MKTPMPQEKQKKPKKADKKVQVQDLSPKNELVQGGSEFLNNRETAEFWYEEGAATGLDNEAIC